MAGKPTWHIGTYRRALGWESTSRRSFCANTRSKAQSPDLHDLFFSHSRRVSPDGVARRSSAGVAPDCVGPPSRTVAPHGIAAPDAGVAPNRVAAPNRTVAPNGVAAPNQVATRGQVCKFSDAVIDD